MGDVDFSEHAKTEGIDSIKRVRTGDMNWYFSFFFKIYFAFFFF